MINSMWTKAPADLLGLGGIDVRPAGPGLCSGSAELVAMRTAAPTAPVQGTGLPAGSTAVRLRPVTRHAIGDVVETTTFFKNNGTPLGNLSPGRPQS